MKKLAVSAFLALNSRNPMQAYTYLRELRPIPKDLMLKFYQHVKKCNTVFHTHLFANLVSAENLTTDQFETNFAKLIVLYLTQNNYEQCLILIRNVECANSGSVPLPNVALEMLVKSAKWHNDVDTAQSAVQAMLTLNQPVYSRTWGMLLQLALDTSDYDALMYVYKHALIPGFLIADDRSYLRIAALGALKGDLNLCEWAALHMRRRQRVVDDVRRQAERANIEKYASKPALRALDNDVKTNDAKKVVTMSSSLTSVSASPQLPSDAFSSQQISESDIEAFKNRTSLEMYTYLIEAAAVSTVQGPLEGAPGLKSVFRYLGRLGKMASMLSIRELPSVICAFGVEENYESAFTFFEALSQDLTAEMPLKTLAMNLLLAANMKFQSDGLIQIGRVASLNNVAINSETTALLMDAASTREEEYLAIGDLMMQNELD